jgi:hypothetical protein
MPCGRGHRFGKNGGIVKLRAKPMDSLSWRRPAETMYFCARYRRSPCRSTREVAASPLMLQVMFSGAVRCIFAVEFWSKISFQSESNRRAVLLRWIASPREVFFTEIHRDPSPAPTSSSITVTFTSRTSNHLREVECYNNKNGNR